MKKFNILIALTFTLLSINTVSAVKIGVLHSLSGTMAISETSLRDVVLMAVDEINKKGGVLGEKIEPVVVDPASDWPLFAEKAKQLILEDKVAVTFGCWTSVSRKSCLPVFEEYNQLLFYQKSYLYFLYRDHSILYHSLRPYFKLGWNKNGCQSTH